ncbi:MAG: hypothetical protein JXA54_16890 [Candidatus Heimdallarchaeota archaeon]|nr:hypothetical protein [Candidatus Heimdallarchaeota archaeon]
MSSSETEKSNILKFVPDKQVELKKYLEKMGIILEKRVVLVNGSRVTTNITVEKDAEIIVLPILRGG